MRSRLRSVLQRTLRRDAQMFLEKPFVGREARLFEYAMAPDEKSLYDDVTQYLLEPGILAFEGRHRQLLLLGFHRRMASSNAALAASLRGVAQRLGRMLERKPEAVQRTRTGKRCSQISKRTMPVPTSRLRSTTGAPRQAPRKSRPSWPASKATSSAPGS